MEKTKQYDLIIIGAGPAGMSAGLYAGRYRLKTLIMGQLIGGTITYAHDIQNYPGFNQISGIDLMKKMEDQVKSQGVEIVAINATKIEKTDSRFIINSTYQAKNIILAMGTSRRKLNIPGETKFIGRGVGYCATCDAAFFRDKITAVIGGGNAAVMAAQLLTEYSSKVYLIYRKDKLRAEPARVETVEKDPKIEIIYNNNVLEVKGDKVVQEVILENNYNGSKILKTDGLFIEIGSVPSTALAKSLGVELNNRDLIKVDSGQRTNIPGIYAAGDITTNSNNLWQIVTAVSEGVIATNSSYQDMKDKKTTWH